MLSFVYVNGRISENRFSENLYEDRIPGFQGSRVLISTLFT
jgi:hypothetical protein